MNQPSLTFSDSSTDFDPLAIIMAGSRPATPPKPRAPLHYYRCNVCLKPLTAEARHQVITCHICEGKAVYLGRAGAGNHLLQDREKCPCDLRCTNAIGPNCDCKCGGLNHGTGLIVEVTETVGTIPKANGRPDFKHKAMAEEYRKALASFAAACRDRYGPDCFDAFGTPRMTGRDYWQYTKARKMKIEAQAMKSQSHRIEKLRTAASYIQKKD